MTNSSEHNNQITIAMVGHCVADEMMLKQFVKKHAPDAKYERVMDEDALEKVLNQHALLLVNRKLDGDFQNESGFGVIERANDSRAKAMLISNLPDAQQASIESGGLPGFGKSQLGEPSSLERLKEAVKTVAAGAKH